MILFSVIKSAMKPTLFVLVILPMVTGFLDDLLRQMGGGGDQFQFEMGEDGGQQLPEWPDHIDEAVGREFTWLKGSTWFWNGWRNVVFHTDGRFEAPSAECQIDGACRWTANDGVVYILWGDAGLHVLRPSDMLAKKGNELKGHRESDGDACYGLFVSRDESTVEHDPYEVLGVQESASTKDIKRAYRKLSVK